MRFVPALLLTVICCGCSNVLSTEPLGHPILIYPEDWEGIWTTLGPKGDDIVLKVHVIDANSGQIRLSDSDGTCTGFVGRYRDWTFVSCHRDSDDGDTDYLWAVVAFKDGVMKVWAPDVDKIGQLVDAGQLPGERDGDDVRLYPLTDADYELMTSEQYGVLLDWKHPELLRRVSTVVGSAVMP